MISHTTEKFWKLYSALPVDIRKQAKIAYIQFKNNPYHPSLQFKRVHSSKPVYSVRINIDYRAVTAEPFSIRLHCESMKYN